ncbi:DivIVA domain-containing protein [Emticicia sp. SJ17W-69]|uniref:DivIVA domain-containing protein n=1 Tax=Emticicia sp. SJ17W-69 TaxID=3421657 RepID=UPI003EBE297F
MKITPLEIRQHEFEKTFRGYNIEEVDSFLANLSQEWERVLNESKMLRMQLEIAEKEANKLREIEMTLFKTLKTAEDTSTMITEQASQQADKHVQEAKILGEKTLIDAQHKAAEIIRQAESRAKYIKEEVLGDVKVLERDFRAMDHYKTNLLVQMRSLSNATLEHVQRFEEKFDKEGVDAKFKEATSMLTDTDKPEIVEEPIETLTSTTPVEEFETEISNIESDDIEEYDDIDTEEIAAENTADETLLEEINEIAVEADEPIIEELEIETPVAEEQEFSLDEEVITSAANNFEEISELEVESEPVKSNVPKTDELDIIEGIGPKISMLLYDAGIFTFRDLAITPVYKIEEILEAAGPQYARHDPSTWTQQAKLAAEGRWDDLEALKGFLIRGKEPELVDEQKEEREEPVIEVVVEDTVTKVEETIEAIIPLEKQVSEEISPATAVVQSPVENNLDSITEEMLEKVNKVKAAIRKAMVEKSDSTVKDNSPLPTVNDVIGKPNESSGGSFFDNI